MLHIDIYSKNPHTVEVVLNSYLPKVCWKLCLVIIVWWVMHMFTTITLQLQHVLIKRTTCSQNNFYTACIIHFDTCYPCSSKLLQLYNAINILTFVIIHERQTGSKFSFIKSIFLQMVSWYLRLSVVYQARFNAVCSNLHIH